MCSTDAGAGRRAVSKRLWPGLILPVSGCATLSKDERQTAEWSALGERDAHEGHGRERLQCHIGACGEHGFAPEGDAYMMGYACGLYRF